MNNKRKRDYLTTHKQIRDKLVELSNEGDRACVEVSGLASELGMDTRTIYSHLKIMEVDGVGVFMDINEKQFCTKQGIALLASMLRLNEKEGE